MRLNLRKLLGFPQFRKTICALVLICITVVMGGCAVQWVYNQLDWLIPWYVRDYLDLNSTQNKWLKIQVGLHLDWHRRTQLPQYAAELNSIAQHIQSKSLNQDDVIHIMNDVDALGAQLVTEIMPDVVVLFKGSTDKQLEKLFEKIEHDNKEFKATYVDVDVHRQNELELKEATNFLKKWLGGLSAEQKDILQKWSEKWIPLKADLYSEQLHWQSEFRACLALRATPQVDICMAQLMLRSDSFYSEEYKRKYAFNLQLTYQLWLALNKSLNDKQRQRAVDRLHVLAQECLALSKQ